MGRPEKEGRCKKHQSHKQSNGVCPYCLRERLAHLSGSPASSTGKDASPSTSASSTGYSSYDPDVSSSMSPVLQERHSGNRLQQLLKRRKKRLNNRSLSFSKETESNKRSIKKGVSMFLAKLVIAGRRKEEVEGELTS